MLEETVSDITLPHALTGCFPWIDQEDNNGIKPWHRVLRIQFVNILIHISEVLGHLDYIKDWIGDGTLFQVFHIVSQTIAISTLRENQSKSSLNLCNLFFNVQITVLIMVSFVFVWRIINDLGSCFSVSVLFHIAVLPLRAKRKVVEVFLTGKRLTEEVLVLEDEMRRFLCYYRDKVIPDLSSRLDSLDNGMCCYNDYKIFNNYMNNIKKLKHFFKTNCLLMTFQSALYNWTRYSAM